MRGPEAEALLASLRLTGAVARVWGVGWGTDQRWDVRTGSGMRTVHVTLWEKVNEVGRQCEEKWCLVFQTSWKTDPCQNNRVKV